MKNNHYRPTFTYTVHVHAFVFQYSANDSHIKGNPRLHGSIQDYNVLIIIFLLQSLVVLLEILSI